MRISGFVGAVVIVAWTRIVYGHDAPHVDIDHTKGTVTYEGYGLKIPISEAGDTIVPLRHGDSLKVTVKDTNTLAYAYDKKIEAIDLEVKKALFDYLGTLNPALTSLAKVLVPAALPQTLDFTNSTQRQRTELANALQNLDTASRTAQRAAQDLSAILADLKTLGHAAAKLDASLVDTIQNVENGAAATTTVPTQTFVSSPKDSAQDPSCTWTVNGTDGSRLAGDLSARAANTLQCFETARRAFVAAQANLANAIIRVENAIDDSGLSDSDKEELRLVVKRPKTQLDEINKLVTTLPAEVLELPRLFLRLQQRFTGLASGKTEKVVATVGYRWDKTQKVTVTVGPKAALSGRLAFVDRSFETVTFSVSPEWPVQAAVGAGFAYIGNLQYPKYALEGEAPNTRVVESGTEDKRFQFVPILSLSPRSWNRLGSWYAQSEPKAANSGRAITFDIGWNVKDDDAAYLAGASVVLARQFKLGGGVIWQKRQVLDGVAVGDATLKTRASYPPEIYFMVSILGWPPFKSGSN